MRRITRHMPSDPGEEFAVKVAPIKRAAFASGGLARLVVQGVWWFERSGAAAIPRAVHMA
ncbi:hypothetical protein [Roseovarius sp. D0-M9]|uniref:hypothetical protein n=1 Tax=Roseovarius sp. D0-M9 TaxID=3127117 RepID=UPI00300F9FBC